MSNFDPAKAENNEDIEHHWAIKAYQHAEIYFNLISSVESSKIKLTQFDQDLYTEFRKSFPDLDIVSIDEQYFTSDHSKALWRKLIPLYETKVQDFNFGTLLRNRCRDDYGPENSFFCTRIQFLCVEVARNVERLNDYVFEQNLGKRQLTPEDSEELNQELLDLQTKITEQFQ